MMRAVLLCCLLILLGAEDTVNRRVLALYDSTERATGTVTTSNIHRLVEAPLNHLGLVVDYADVAHRPLPDPRAYRGIIIWFGDDIMPKPGAYAAWLIEALGAGVRLVCFNDLGAVRDERGEAVDPLFLIPVLEAWGLRLDEEMEASDNPAQVRCDDVRPEFFDYEVSTPAVAIRYPARLVPLSPAVQVWRSLRRADRDHSDSVAVAVGPLGGFCSGGVDVVRTVTQPVYVARWDLDPYAFLSAALALDGLPRLDATTAWGNRLAFSSIDGDGLLNGTRDLPGAPRLAGAVVRDDLLARLKFPVTVSFVMAELEQAADRAGALALAKSITALPNVQLGSHGYTHPLLWDAGKLGVPVKGFAYTPANEITTAVDHTERLLAQPDQHVEIFLWTGDCLAPLAGLETCERLGILELNGGDSRFDGDYPSVTGVAPLTRWVAGRRQTYAASCNENLYTELWTENFGGFRNVIETFRRSEAPRRLLPVQVYYHWYSGERLAALRALGEVYAWCQQQPLCWLTAADYVRRVHGFMDAQVARCGDGWRITHAGCPTVRFDHETRQPDLKRSVGVLGASRHGTTLYCTLDPEQPFAELYFTNQPGTFPHLESSTAPLRKVVATATSWRAWARCCAAGRLVLHGFSPASSVMLRCGTLLLTLTADHNGVITVPLPPGDGQWVEVVCGL